jgi:hypothetical protein
MVLPVHYNCLLEVAVSSPSPDSQSAKSPARKRISGVPLFLLRLVIMFAILGVVSTLFELELDFIDKKTWLLIVILPLGWAGALVLSAWLVGMIFYNKDDPSDEA